MQSGRAKGRYWLIEPQLITKREPEPLMGWTSAGDTHSELFNKLKFDSAEAAAAFAKEKGWSYIVIPPHQRKNPISNYMDNFKYQPPSAASTSSPGGKATVGEKA